VKSLKSWIEAFLLPFLGSVMSLFQGLFTLKLRGGQAALDPVASELRHSLALTSIFQAEFFLRAVSVRVSSAVMTRIMLLALWRNLILRVTFL
jgi:hypothetical protein